eukprot:CAMPEP_0184332882 /NCGR_PEP_ID=MMETSP1089-20130417/2012_1 /TAXON_ID=38269 ORGANISM="Gloeochaete wittrockiana, Strain SAG46.84" /NCGR_SAMPLE_ID=MMETSP1089 /ASSEMBLY_ACC=CAM_ASM_000445 /LENGTH=319 /DNA_ID=CAMNT_0026656461 /DNA_START=32 /DNA_END=991 /DNA_ORIENTATION=+
MASLQIVEFHGKTNRISLSSWGARICDWNVLDPVGNTWRKICKGNGRVAPTQDAYRHCVMFPWVNRVRPPDWTLSENGKPDVRVKVEPFPGNLHGLLVDAIFEVTESTPSTVMFETTLSTSAQYPVPLRCYVMYRLEMVETPNGSVAEEALSVQIIAKNLGERRAYVTTGLHPYFLNPYADNETGGGLVDHMAFFCAAEKEVEVDEQLLPRGLHKVKTEHAFHLPEGRLIGQTKFDNGFVVKKGSPIIASLRIRNFQLHILAGQNSEYVQVYIPGDRHEIAIEPQSGGADAYHHHQYGLALVDPAQEWRFSTVMYALFA